MEFLYIMIICSLSFKSDYFSNCFKTAGTVLADDHSNGELGEQTIDDDTIIVPLKDGLYRVRRDANQSTPEEELEAAVVNGLTSVETQTFLDTFQEKIQKDMVWLQLEKCPLIPLCTFSLNISVPPWMSLGCCEKCECGLLYCMKRSTCCPDIIPPKYFRLRDQDTDHNPVPLVSRSETDASKSSDENPFELKYNPSLHCTLGHAMASNDVDQDSWMMHATCMERTNQTVVAKCEQDYSIETVTDMEDIVPVTAFHLGITYRNKHCAMCGGVNTCEDCLESWDILLSCDSLGIDFDLKNIIYYVYRSKTCEITFQPRISYTAMPPELCTTSISSCNITGSWAAYDPVIERQCLLYTSVFHILTNTTLYSFQNVFCAVCNGIDIDVVACSDPSTAAGVPFSFTGLLTFETYARFTDIEAHQSTDRGPGTCSSQNEVYDPLTGDCIQTYCSIFFVKENGDCVRLVSNSSFGRYSIHVTLRPAERLNISLTVLLTDSIVFKTFTDYILQALESTEYHGYNPFYLDDYSVFYTLVGNVTYEDIQSNRGNELGELAIDVIHVQILLAYDDFHDVYDLYDKLQQVNNKRLLYYEPYMYLKIITFRLNIDNDNIIFQELQTIVSKSSPPPGINYYFNISDDDARRLGKLARTSSVIIPYINRGGYGAVELSAYVDITTLLECSLIKLYKDQVHWNKYEDTIRISIDGNGSIVLNFSHYFHDGQDDSLVYVCADHYLHQFEQGIVLLNSFPPNLVKSSLDIILSVVCICVSLLCLFVTVVIYVVVPSLRTVPGLNILSLCVSLMVAQSLYLLTAFGKFEQGSRICIMVGLLMHLMWLLAIFWMSGCTIHMFRVLTSSQQMATSLSTHLQYHIYTILASLVFVGINIGVSLGRSKGFDVGYGKVSCYFSVEDLLNYTFALPVLGVVVKNFTLFAVVAIRLRRQSFLRKHTQNERNDLLIFTKLSSLTGITWLVGFLYAWTIIEAMSYAFIVLNASQGLFIMLSFATNSRVYQVYKKAHSSTSSKSSTKRM